MKEEQEPFKAHCLISFSPPASKENLKQFTVGGCVSNCKFHNKIFKAAQRSAAFQLLNLLSQSSSLSLLSSFSFSKKGRNNGLRAKHTLQLLKPLLVLLLMLLLIPLLMPLTLQLLMLLHKWTLWQLLQRLVRGLLKRQFRLLLRQLLRANQNYAAFKD